MQKRQGGSRSVSAYICPPCHWYEPANSPVLAIVLDTDTRLEDQSLCPCRGVGLLEHRRKDGQNNKKETPYNIRFLAAPFVRTDFFLTFATVLVSRLPIATGTWWKGNQVQILNRPAAVSSSPNLWIRYKPLSVTGWEGIQRRNKSEDLPRTNIVLMLSGNKAAKHRVRSIFISLHKEIVSPCVHSP